MEIRDSGVIVEIRNYTGDKKLIKILSKTQGIWKGITFFKGGISLFDEVEFVWKSKSLDNLGFFQLEIKNNYFVDFFNDGRALLCLKNTSLMLTVLPERIDSEELFLMLQDMLHSSGKSFLANYLYFIVFFFRELGYPLDLYHCAVTGQTSDLMYVSPKTGRAVSSNAAGVYKDRLLKMPAFFKKNHENYDEFNEYEFIEALSFFEYFYQKHIENNSMILFLNEKIKKSINFLKVC